MNLDEIPTPETNAFMLEYNRAIAAQKTRPSMWDKLQSLERRLTIAREALERFEGCIDGYEYINSAEKALTQTAPKP